MIFSFVTALYPIRDGYLSDLQTRFQDLLSLLPQVTIYVWTDRAWPSITDTRIKWLCYPLKSFWSFNISMTPHCQLPIHRDCQKDTQPFMALMNTKIEMLWRVEPFLEIGTCSLIWIDAGISKIFRNSSHVQQKFQHLLNASCPERILMPGCWRSGKPISRDAVHWRCCGGFLIVPLCLLSQYQSLSEKWLQQFYEIEKRAIWEVNVWAEMEQDVPTLFEWYAADHNDTILNAPVHMAKN